MDLAYGTLEDDKLIESSSLLKKSNISYDYSNKKSNLWNNILKIFIFSMLLTSLFAFISYKYGLFKEEDKITLPISYTVSTSYGVHDSVRFPYPWLDDSIFVETYKSNQFDLDSPNKGCIYHYDIAGVSDPSFAKSGISLDGSFTFEPTTTGQFNLQVSEYCSKKIFRTHAKNLWSKYVRREVSALSDDDREEFLDAFATLWAVKTQEGKELYGEDYKSLYHFAVVHNDAGSNPICDQFHTGSGFINNHIYLGSYLEQMMRLVNPRVSLHYMEYGVYFSGDDYLNHQVNQLDGGAWSEIFTEKFFGTNDPYTGKIINGRWADFTVPYLTDEFLESEEVSSTSTFFSNEENEWLKVSNPHLMNPYGLLRSPWNYSPANYTVRYNNVNQFNSYFNVDPAVTNYYNGVDCDDYEYFVSDEIYNQPLYTLLSDVEDDVHGKIHFTFGGSGGDHCIETNQYLYDTYGLTWQHQITISQSSQKFFKSVIGFRPTWSDHYETDYFLDCTDDPWQNGVLTTTAAPGETNGPSCSCNSLYFQNSTMLTKLIQQYFIDWYGQDNTQSETIDLILSLDFDEQVDVMNRLCGRFQFEGDLAGSGAATDPIFWVVHGGVERLMQKIYFEGVLTNYEYVEHRSTCSGHAKTGTKDWLKGYKLEDESIQAELLTNEELAAYLDPTSDLYRDQIDFVYDHYDWKTICDGEANSWFSP